MKSSARRSSAGSWAVLSAVLLILCYPPFSIWSLAYVALVPLLLVTATSGLWAAVGMFGLTGFIFSSALFYGVLAYGLPAFLLVTLSYSIAFGLWAYLIHWLSRRLSSPWMAVFSPALLWCGIETLAGSPMVGVPMYLGLSQSTEVLLIQSAAWLGISGVSFFVVLVNSALAYGIRHIRSQWHVAAAPLLAVVSLAAMVVGHGWWVIAKPHEVARPISVTALQPVIESHEYHNSWQQPENRTRLRTTIHDLTLQAGESGAQMIFWAEGGNGYLNLRIPALREQLFSLARDKSIDLLVSSRDMDTEGKVYNSVFSIGSQGVLLGRYDKSRLLPFAEKALSAGMHQQPLQTTHGLLGVAICYESVFPEPLRKQVEQGASLLFVTSSDAAFKRASLALLHAQLSVFRAVENGKWLVRAANTGPSLVVSPQGLVVAESEFYQRGILSAQVESRSETSFFTRFGHYLPKLLALAVMALLVYCIWVSWSAWLRHPVALQKQKKRTAKSPALPVKWRILPVIQTLGLMVFAVSMAIASSHYLSSGVDYFSRKSLSDSLAEVLYLEDTPVQDVVSQRFLQAASNTCGAASLAFVLSYLGRETREAEVVSMISMTAQGTSMLELKQAAEKLAFSAMGVSENYRALRSEALPVIAYINDDHYVVITEVDAHFVQLFDPALGNIRIHRQTFEQAWNGYLLLVRPKPIVHHAVPAMADLLL